MKKKLLMTFDGRRYGETYRPVFLSLKDDFDIWILGYDISTPAYAREELDRFIKEGIIKWYSLCPTPPFCPVTLWEKHAYINDRIKELKGIDFDVWLTCGELQVLERYIQAALLPKKCLRVVLWVGMTYLFENENLVRGLLAKTDRGRKLLGQMSLSESPAVVVPQFQQMVKRLRRMAGWVKRTPGRLRKYGIYLQDRLLLPFIFCRKLFFYGPYDRMTQMGSGRSDAYLFCDEAEAVVHETLFGKSKFFVVDLPVKEYDATAHKLTRKALLSPSSIFILQKDIADKYLALLLRDFKMALERTGAEEIDLRMHPDDRTDWYKKLIAYLNDHGVKIKMVGCEKPIREVIVDYVGMVGLSSCTLRDARVARKDIPVIGFEGASKFRFKNPIFVYSLSDGIDWILEDGSWRQTRKDVSYKKADKRPIREVIFSLLNEGAAR